LHLFSAVSGIVTDQGWPVEGAEVEHWYRWHWWDRSGTDRTTMDSSGRFSFPEIAVRSFPELAQLLSSWFHQDYDLEG